MSQSEETELRQSDPLAYLAQRKFSSIIKCPRTGLRVSYAQLGDPDGIPVLFLMPAGASRWLAVPQGGAIVVDRPGIGATPVVPLQDRIRLTCEMMVSVLEHLKIKLSHLIAASAGIYYALHLLLHHPEIFQTILSPPPHLYLISAWSPPLPPDHPDWYRSYLSYIPTGLIKTQHFTIPHLTRIGKSASTLWESLSNKTTSLTRLLYRSEDAVVQEPEEEVEVERRSDWGDFGDQCCLSCTMMKYCQAEELRGMGEDHLLCLNRGSNTGYEWFERTISSLAFRIVSSPSTQKPQECPPSPSDAVPRQANVLKVDIWWGLQDAMVPRPGQLWLNRALSQEGIKLNVHDVPDGDHNNL
ncbi:hypothetical protein M231_00418 [Tremella mesenterica]|uniref:AB hydrolase-1 domain-containing protein n=1 Tax=Tremella mesenterica TaxID=5217 RepID=A0A4Q1BWB5_TREME|nr:hypothetical protein M231_00418 [Tremella mesenterica]